MIGWETRKQWSDGFLPEIKRILGEHLIKTAPEEEDRKHNSDLIVLKLGGIRVACRVRKYEYYKRYPCEFTIRSKLPSGMDSELTKVVAGWGDYIFYGFANEAEDNLIAWILGDLKCFRLWFNRYLCKYKKEPGLHKYNGDGSSSFYAYDWQQLPNEFIVAKQLLDETLSL
jgi:hypothetical protein